jgi:hypothetical protein
MRRYCFPRRKPTNHGSYVAIVTNAYGAVTSAVVSLVVTTPEGSGVQNGFCGCLGFQPQR